MISLSSVCVADGTRPTLCLLSWFLKGDQKVGSPRANLNKIVRLSHYARSHRGSADHIHMLSEERILCCCPLCFIKTFCCHCFRAGFLSLSLSLFRAQVRTTNIRGVRVFIFNAEVELFVMYDGLHICITQHTNQNEIIEIHVDAGYPEKYIFLVAIFFVSLPFFLPFREP